MSYNAKQLRRAARKLGYVLVEGKKHTRVYDAGGKFISTIPRGKVIKPGTLSAILKQLGITEDKLRELI